MTVAVNSRVLMLVENNPYPQDGRVRREAITLTRAGYRVSVICPQGPGQPWREVIQGIQVYRFPAPLEAHGFLGYIWEYGYATLAMFLLSLLVFGGQGFDVVHTHNPPDTLVFIATFYKLLGRRFVYDQHDLAPEMYQALFGGSNRGPVYKVLVWLERLSLRLADAVIATNHSYKVVEMERGPIAEARISIVRNGPDLNSLKLTEPEPTLRSKGKTTLCYVGSMGFHDGVDYLLRALRHLIFELGRTDFLCVLVGAGEAWPKMKRLSEQLGLADSVLFIGQVAHHEVARYLSAADICVAPEPSNGYNDRSTMIKITEYMALAKPIVAFDLPEHRVTAQAAAAYAHPNDELDFARQIALLMDDPARRAKMGQLGRARIETELAWSHQEKYLLQVYQKLSRRRQRSLFPNQYSDDPLG